MWLWAKGCRTGGVGVHGATVFLREIPCCSNLQTHDFFWNKKIFKQSPLSPPRLVFAFNGLYAFVNIDGFYPQKKVLVLN